MTFPLLIFSIDRQIFAGDAEALTLPSLLGQIQILAKHAPLTALLKAGDIVIKEKDKEQKIPIEGGVVEANPERVVVLARF